MMDLSNLDLGVGEIISGIVAMVLGAGWMQKKYSFDKLDITKSATERELIELVREELARLKHEAKLMKEKYDELEELSKKVGLERDELSQKNKLYEDDIIRLKDKINIMDGIINRLTEALQITSNKLDDD